MLRTLKSLTLTVATTAILVTGATAADFGDDDDFGSWKDGPISPPSPTYYVALRGGIAQTDDTDFTVLGGLDVSNSYDLGYTVSGAVGADLGQLFGLQNFRAELEVAYIESDIDTHTLPQVGAEFSGADAFGTTSATIGFASLYYDLFSARGFTPFVGAGLGLASVDFDNHGITPTGTVLSDDQTAFAWHGTVGASLEITHNKVLELGYRYIALSDVDLTSIDGTPSSTDVDNHTGFVGLRIGF